MKGVRSRLAKTLIHEVGHNYGLEHCDDRECVISATDGNYDIDCQDIFFCGNCVDELGLDNEERGSRIEELEKLLSE
jgi:archaemetzincin